MNSLSSKQQLLQLLQIQSLELHQDFSTLARTDDAGLSLNTEALADINPVVEMIDPLVTTQFGSYVEPDKALPFSKDLLRALDEYQPDLQWRINPVCTEPLALNGLLVTPSIELLQSAQQKKLLWLCLQREN